MKEIKIFLIITFLLSLVSCMQKMSPVIIYENVSKEGKIIKNVKIKLNKTNLLTRDEDKFCGGLTQIYKIDKYDDLFGPIHIEWENANGQKLIKDLTLTKDQLPRIGKLRSSLLSVTLYFTQDNVYLYTSDTPNLKQVEADLYKKAGLTCQEYRDQEYIKKWGKDW